MTTFTMIKRLAATAAVALSVGGAAGAQPSPPPTQAQMQAQADAARDRLYKELGVTAAQKQKLTAIENKYKQIVRGRYQAFSKKYPKATPAQQQSFMAEMQSIAPKARAESMAVLTPAQRVKLKKMMAAQSGNAPR